MYLDVTSAAVLEQAQDVIELQLRWILLIIQAP